MTEREWIAHRLEATAHMESHRLVVYERAETKQTYVLPGQKPRPQSSRLAPGSVDALTETGEWRVFGRDRADRSQDQARAPLFATMVRIYHVMYGARTEKEVRVAYKELSLLYHPDKTRRAGSAEPHLYVQRLVESRRNGSFR